jgi:excisionase family DNA binding protein
MNTPNPQDISTGVVLDNYMSIDAAVEYSGYNAQYFRKLMRKGVIEGVKIGQVWLVNIESLDTYLEGIRKSGDRRYGPRVYHEYVGEQG